MFSLSASQRVKSRPWNLERAYRIRRAGLRLTIWSGTVLIFPTQDFCFVPFFGTDCKDCKGFLFGRWF